MRFPHKTLEKKLFADGYQLIYAVDEVGVGCLAGPVVACAVAFDKKFFDRKNKKLRGIRDSKLLSVKQREKFATQLLLDTRCLTGVGYCRPKTIDKLNIFNASRLAMKKAVKKVSSNLHLVSDIQNTKYKIQDTKLKSVVLVDGPHKIPKLDMEQRAIIQGDRKVFSIACASIIAKVYRDKMMVRYAKKYPEYGFEKHKGYGTRYHQAKLASLGPCRFHRKSFRLVY